MTTVDEATRIQILRSIDKVDRVGLVGVFQRLTSGCLDASGSWVEGVGLDRADAMLLVNFVCVGASSSHRRQVADRLSLMSALEDTVLDEESSRTAWDVLLDMPANEDETWRDGGRPRNIGWALDDLVKFSRR